MTEEKKNKAGRVIAVFIDVAILVTVLILFARGWTPWLLFVAGYISRTLVGVLVEGAK